MSDNEHSTAPLGHSEVACIEHPPSDAVPEVGQRCQYDSEVPTAVRGEKSGYVLNEQPGGSKSIGDASEFVEEATAGSGESGSVPCNAEVLAGEPTGEKVNAPGDAEPGRGCDRNVSATTSGVPRPVPSSDASWPSAVSACVTTVDAGRPPPWPVSVPVWSASSHRSQSSESCAFCAFTNTDGADILPEGGVGPVGSQDGSLVGVGFALGDDADACSFESEIETTYS